MEAIQTVLLKEALVTALRTNMCDFFRHISRSNPREHFEDEHFTRWYTPFPHLWFSGVLASDLPTSNARSFISETIGYFHNKGVDTFTWWTAPHLNPSDWESVLSKHNFGFYRNISGLAMDLHELNESTQPEDALEIRVVEDEESLRSWVKVLVKCYDLAPDQEPLTFDVWMKLGLDFPLRNYLGYYDGEPVSASSLFMGRDAAGVYGISTLPRARGKGFGSALTLRPLLDACEMGYRIGVVPPSEIVPTISRQLPNSHLCQVENYYLIIM